MRQVTGVRASNFDEFKEKERKLREVRARILMSRPVCVETVLSLVNVWFNRNMWEERRAIDGCHVRCIPRHLARNNMPQGCWSKLREEIPDLVYVFEALTSTGGSFQVNLCLECYYGMWSDKGRPMVMLGKLFRNYDGRKLADFLPIYIDVNRTKDHWKKELRECEQMSEDEDNGTDWDPDEGRLNVMEDKDT